MALIGRRKKSGPTTRPPVDDDTALAAASAPVPPEKWGRITKPAAGDRDGGKWAEEAWTMVSLVGELSAAILWKTALLSRFRLVASDVDPETGRPTGSTNNALAKEIVAQIAGGATGQSQMLGRLAPLLMVPGESWLAIIHPEGRGEEWHILSKKEIKISGGGQEVELLLFDGSTYKMREEIDTLSRIWRQDPEQSWLAWSPVKAALPVLRRIVRMEQGIEAAGKSRVAANGILLLPLEVSMSTAPPPTGAKPADPDAPNLPPTPPRPSARQVNPDEIRKALQTAMETAIQDPNSAAALVPIILMIKGEYIQYVKHLKFDSDVSDKALEALREGVIRLARTLDMPAEVLLGVGDLNHWSLRGVEMEAVRWHAAPEMETICDALTRELLYPYVPADSGVVIWYDTTDVQADADDTEKLRQAFLDGVVNSRAYGRGIGAGDDDGYDLTTREGLALWVSDTVRRRPELLADFAGVLAKLVPELSDLPAPALPPAQPRVIDAPALPAREPDTRENSAATVLRMCVNTALRLAGQRRASRSDRDRLRAVPARELYRHLSAAAPSEVRRLIEGWDDALDEQLLAGIDRDALRRTVVQVCAAALTTRTAPVLNTAAVRSVMVKAVSR